MAKPSTSQTLQMLSRTHKITHLTVISSSKIHTKVVQISNALKLPCFDSAVASEAAEKDDTNVIVAISAKGLVASKLISVVEIMKREVVRVQKEGGHGVEAVYQYSALGSEPGRVKGTALDEIDGGDEGDGEYFETMKAQAGRDASAVEAANLQTPRDVPVLTIYLSRTPVPELRERFGEQKS